LGTIRILLADDHTVLRQSLAVLIEKESDLKVIGQAADGTQVVDFVDKTQPDLVLMDIAMPNLNGIEAASRIKKKYPEVKVLVLSMHSDERYMIQAFRAGATGYILKDASKEELFNAIRAVSQGDSYLSPRISKKLIDDYIRLSDNSPDDPYYSHLTSRQREIFQLMAENRSTREIGKILSISPKTAQNHRTNIMEKLNLHSQSDVLKYALRIGLIKMDG